MNREDKEKLIMQGRKENGWDNSRWFPSLADLDDDQINVLYRIYENNGTVIS